MISSTMPEKNEERWDPSLFCPPFFLPLFSVHSVHSVGSHISKCINIYTACTSISRLKFSLFAFGIDAIPLISLQLDAYILLAFSQLASRLNSIFIFPRQLYQSPTAPLSAFCIPHALPRRLGSVPISSLHARHTHTPSCSLPARLLCCTAEHVTCVKRAPQPSLLHAQKSLFRLVLSFLSIRLFLHLLFLLPFLDDEK